MEEVMDYLFELFKILIPAVSIVVVVQVMLKNHFDDQKRRDELIVSKANRQDLKPLQMQAYERLILFLERLQPDNLMMRTQRPGMSSRMLHTSMLKAIRQEYEHNMTQQLYISPSAWKLVLMAKDEVAKLVNLSSSQLTKEATAIDFAQQLANIVGQLDKIPTDVAINGLKLEFQSKFRT
ncbi:MAG: hypothetical protein ACI85Q_002759 [Salibacteraceae bacterium]|jgi:hypothetical protein